MKTILLLALTSLFVAAAPPVVSPKATIETEGNVIEIVVRGDTLYAATDAGKLEVYDWKSRKLLQEYRFGKIHDFMGDPIDPKVFGVDISADGSRMIVQVQDEEGERKLWLYEGGKRRILLDRKDHIAMREVRFVDRDHLLIATMSDELILFEIPTKKRLYQRKLSLSVFSDYQLDEKRERVAASCESGIVYVVDVRSGNVLKTLEGGNKDNVFKVDFKNDHILACGQDRKAVIYRLPGGEMTIYETDFLVYAGALNDDASLSAFDISEQNDIGIFDNATKTMKYLLKGQESTLNTIVFVGEKELISSSDDNHILIWRIP